MTEPAAKRSRKELECSRTCEVQMISNEIFDVKDDGCGASKKGHSTLQDLKAPSARVLHPFEARKFIENMNHVSKPREKPDFLFRCDCSLFKSFCSLPCRHVIAVMLYLYGTCSIKDIVPRRWSSDFMKFLADEITLEERTGSRCRDGPVDGGVKERGEKLARTEEDRVKAFRNARDTLTEKDLFKINRRHCVNLASILSRRDIVDASSYVKYISLVMLMFDCARSRTSIQEQEVLRILFGEQRQQRKDFLVCVELARKQGVKKSSLPSESDMEDENEIFYAEKTAKSLQEGACRSEEYFVKAEQEKEVQVKAAEIGKEGNDEKVEVGVLESSGENMEKEDACRVTSKTSDLRIEGAQSGAQSFTSKRSVPNVGVKIPNVKAPGRPRKKKGPAVRRQSYMKTRCAALFYASKNTPVSRYAEGGETKLLSLNEVLSLISSERCTTASLLAVLDKLPRVIISETRNTTYVSRDEDSEIIRRSIELESQEIRFLLPQVMQHLKRLRKRIEKGVQSGGSFNLEEQGSMEQKHGVLVEICEFNGQSKALSQSSTFFFPQKVLLEMRKVLELDTLLTKCSLLFSWLSEVGMDHDLVNPSKKQVLQWGEQTRKALMKAHPFRLLGDRSGCAFTMSSLIKFRGQLRMKPPDWLDSDCIHIAQHRIERSMRSSFRSFIFFFPPFPWGEGAGLGHDKYDPKVTIKILEDCKHPLLELNSHGLRRALLYTIVNVRSSHWVALEACFGTKRIVIFDPAKEGGVDLPDNPISSRLITFLEEFSVRKCVPWVAEPWKIRMTLGGQQQLSKDSVNCGVIAAEWIWFRIQSDVTLRVAKEPQHSRDVLRECRMRDCSLYDWDLLRLQMLHYAAQNALPKSREKY